MELADFVWLPGKNNERQNDEIDSVAGRDSVGD
jgi:hypothetical protein